MSRRMSGADEYKMIGVKAGTKERFQEKKVEAGGAGLTDDAYLNMLLDALESGILRVKMVRNGRRNGA